MGYYLRRNGQYFNAYDSLSYQLIGSGDYHWLINAIAELGYTRHDYMLSMDPRTQEVARVGLNLC